MLDTPRRRASSRCVSRASSSADSCSEAGNQRETDLDIFEPLPPIFAAASSSHALMANATTLSGEPRQRSAPPRGPATARAQARSRRSLKRSGAQHSEKEVAASCLRFVLRGLISPRPPVPDSEPNRFAVALSVPAAPVRSTPVAESGASQGLSSKTANPVGAPGMDSGAGQWQYLTPPTQHDPQSPSPQRQKPARAAAGSRRSKSRSSVVPC
jgi:hypothetical protein